MMPPATLATSAVVFATMPISVREADVEEERRRQRGGHRVADLEQEDERDDEQRTGPAVALDEFAERQHDRVAQVAWRRADHFGFAHDERHQDARQHERAGEREHDVPRQVVGQDQRQRAGDQRGELVRVHVDRVAEALLGIAQQLAAIGVDHDVGACAEERDERGERGDRPDRVTRRHEAERGDRARDQQLREQQPAAPAARPPAGQARDVAVHQRRPQELPRVRELDQREQADFLQVHALGAQPGLYEVDEREEGQTRREAQEHADQHVRVQVGSPAGVILVSGECGRLVWRFRHGLELDSVD